MVSRTCNKYHQNIYKLDNDSSSTREVIDLENEAGVTVIIVGNRRERVYDAAIDSDGPALEQHCPNVSRRPYSQPRALRECIGRGP